MLIDHTTLSDLEIFGAADGAGGLFHLVDRTSTTRGHTALKHRFQRPSSDPRVIRRTQDAIRFLQRYPDALLLTDPALESVARYLRSNITIGTTPLLGDRLEYAWMRLRYRDLLGELEAGIEATVALFSHVSDACAVFREIAVPPLLAEAFEVLAATSQAVLRARTETRSLLRLDRTLRLGHRQRIEEALGLLGELDALNAMAASTSSLGWVMPDIIETDGFSLEADDVVHPFVHRAVPNPVRLTGGEPMVFLTGPNMAGKTTYLRTVGLVVLLGQVGMGVPARRARFTPVEALCTSLNPSDNLRAGLSYFLSEVLRVKAAASLLAEGRRALVLFDEIFKGTNVRDALDASAEVILGFARARRSGFIFASHLAELVAVLEANPAIRFCYFDGDIVHDTPRYTYELRDGVSDKRFGLLLLRRAGVPELMERISV